MRTWLKRRENMPSSIALRCAKCDPDGPARSYSVFGNAPVALMELNRLIMEEGIRPALVIAMPVGFVHVVESKEELMSWRSPFIAIAGRRGAAACCQHSARSLLRGCEESSPCASKEVKHGGNFLFVNKFPRTPSRNSIFRRPSLLPVAGSRKPGDV